MSSEFLALPGAVEGTDIDAGVAAHYGNPFVEQRSLAAGEAVVDLSHHAVLSISGPDRLSWLDSLTSQSVKNLAPGESSETLLLDPQGRLEYAVKLIDDGETVWLLLEAAEAEPLLAWLTRMRFMLRVEIADRTAEFATIGSLGAPDLPVVAPAGVPLAWRDPWVAVTAGGHQYAAQAGHPAAGWTWSESLVPRTALAEVAAAHPVAGILAAEALRVEAWRPRLALDADERTIPHELDWLRSAVHLNKGCYRGQETVAKVHNLGHPPRRLVMLHLDGSDDVLPDHGSEVLLGDTVVGRITSVARHHELGPIALAVVKRSVDPSAPLIVAAGESLIAAAQEVIVPTDAGASASVPRLPRLGAVQR
ncbi:CAF17-like 4Fe-4S cluster assembly/insertion protein YgfZ [Marisediminicola senii]|uniref:CAF17-like 4Fe-4S cluster assembly/insertion protein YgfZ n=1 Tax=Marisediminicola senii TaxID=2711233 RepID=UPI0013EA288D|nr:folate-binding protein YgfZ [Marisediminicola senii]